MKAKIIVFRSRRESSNTGANSATRFGSSCGASIAPPMSAMEWDESWEELRYLMGRFPVTRCSGAKGRA
jgi:hypothetical protein